MDVFIFFGEIFVESGDLKKVVEVCRKGGDSMVDLQVKLGRVMYVGQLEGDMLFDFGVMVFVIVVEGIFKVYSFQRNKKYLDVGECQIFIFGFDG